MLRLVTRNLWPILRRKASASKLRRAAIAYVTDATWLPLQPGDLLVTDASNAAIAGGRTSAAALAEYFESGVELFSLNNLHAKVAVFDDWAIIGSANVSQHSAAYYIEAAVVTDRPDLVGETEKFVWSLAKASTAIDKSFVDRISSIPVVRASGPPLNTGGGRKRVRRPSRQRFWFLGIPDDEPYSGDPDKIDALADDVQRTVSKKAGSVDWFWWPISARFSQKASVGDIVIDCWRPHSPFRSTKPVRVYKHARIARIEREKGVKAKAFLCVWEPKNEQSKLPWKSFLGLAQRAGIRRKLTPNSAVELTARQSSALYELWDS